MTSPVLISERDFTGQIRDIARAFGYLRYHAWLSKHSPAGFPDEVWVRPPRIVFAELKAEKGKLSEAQAVWLTTLARCNLEVLLLRPHMLEQLIDYLRPRERPEHVEWEGIWEP